MSRSRKDQLAKLQKAPQTQLSQEIEDVSLHIKLDKDEYYENEVINGTVVMRFARDMSDFTLKLSLSYTEQFTLFNDEG